MRSEWSRVAFENLALERMRLMEQRHPLERLEPEHLTDAQVQMKELMRSLCFRHSRYAMNPDGSVLLCGSISFLNGAFVLGEDAVVLSLVDRGGGHFVAQMHSRYGSTNIFSTETRMVSAFKMLNEQREQALEKA